MLGQTTTDHVQSANAVAMHHDRLTPITAPNSIQLTQYSAQKSRKLATDRPRQAQQAYPEVSCMPCIAGLAVLLAENRTTPRYMSSGVFRARSGGLSEAWSVPNERVLVCSAARSAAVDVRAAKRLAGQTHISSSRRQCYAGEHAAA